MQIFIKGLQNSWLSLKENDEELKKTVKFMIDNEEFSEFLRRSTGVWKLGIE